MSEVGIQKVRYTHEGMINWLISNPDRSQRDAALYFNITESWLSCVVNSDAFKMKLHERQEQVFSLIAAGIPEKLNAATAISLDKLTAKLIKTDDGGYILDATEKLLKANGYAPQGQRTVAPVNHGTLNQTIIVGAKDLDEARNLMANVPVQPALPEKVVEEVKD